MSTNAVSKNETLPELNAVAQMSGDLNSTVILTKAMSSLDEGVKSQIHNLTVSVWRSEQEIANHQAFICINLYKLKMLIGENWRPFVKANFELMSMSVRSFDRKVKFGELISEAIARSHNQDISDLMNKFTGGALAELFLLDEKGVDIVLQRLNTNLLRIGSKDVTSATEAASQSLKDRVEVLERALTTVTSENDVLKEDVEFMNTKSANLQNDMLVLKKQADSLKVENSKLKSSPPVQIVEPPKHGKGEKRLSESGSIVSNEEAVQLRSKISELRADMQHLTAERNQLTRVVNSAKESETLTKELTDTFASVLAKFHPDMLKVMAKSNNRSSNQLIQVSKIARQFASQIDTATQFEVVQQ